MKKFTVITSIIAMAALAFTLTACGADNPQSNDNSNQPSVEQNKPDTSTPTAYPTISAAIDAAQKSDGSDFSTQPIILSGTVAAVDENNHGIVLYDGDMSSTAVIMFDQDEPLPQKGASANICGYISRVYDNGGDAKARARSLYMYKGHELAKDKEQKTSIFYKA